MTCWRHGPPLRSGAGGPWRHAGQNCLPRGREAVARGVARSAAHAAIASVLAAGHLDEVEPELGLHRPLDCVESEACCVTVSRSA